MHLHLMTRVSFPFMLRNLLFMRAHFSHLSSSAASAAASSDILASCPNPSLPPSIHPSIHTSRHPSLPRFLWHCTSMSGVIYPAIFLLRQSTQTMSSSVRLPVSLSVRLFVRISVCLVHTPFRLPMHACIHPCINPCFQ